MKILLINPPQSFYKKSQFCTEQLPLSILYVAGLLIKENLEVEVLDALREGDNLSCHDDYWQYGLSWENIAKKIRTSHPDIIGISNPYTSQVENAIKVADLVKMVDPRIVTVLGGAHPTVAANDLMNSAGSVDICVRGEGEYVMRDLIKYYFIEKKKKLDGIPGLVYRVNNMILESGAPETISELDDLPFPAYETLDMEKYLSKHYKLTPSWLGTTRVVEMVTSRGCPYNCIFCSVHCVMGNKFRAHSPAYVLKHIAYLIAEYKVRHIRFNDDNISFDRYRFDSIVSGIIKRKLRFSWDCPNGLRADNLDKKLLEKMKESGCEHIYIAAESGNQEVLDKIIKKNIDLTRIEETLRLCNQVKLQADVYFVLGLPGETLDTMHQTVKLGLRFFERYNASPLFFIATPLPGTELLKICKTNNYLRKEIAPRDYSSITQGGAVICTPDFTSHQVNSIFYSANGSLNRMNNKKNILLLFTHPLLFFKKAYKRLKNLIK